MKAKIDITTIQYDENNNKDIIKITTMSDIFYKNDGIYLIYKEESEGIKVTNTIKIQEDEVMIKKFGDTNSVMKLKRGNVHTTNYRTPQGVFIIETHTKKLNIDKNVENSIKLDIEYDIKIMDFFAGRNNIKVNIEIQN